MDFLPYTAIRCKKLADEPVECPRVQALARSRHMQFICNGMRVECDGKEGYITGADGCYFKIHFVEGYHKNMTVPCHPTWRMKYFDNDGSILYDGSEVTQ